MEPRFAPVLWPRREDYPRFNEVCGGKLASFKRYQADIDAYVKKMKARGVDIERIEFDPEDLLAFARARGRSQVDREIRVAFAIHLKVQAEGSV